MTAAVMPACFIYWLSHTIQNIIPDHKKRHAISQLPTLTSYLNKMKSFTIERKYENERDQSKKATQVNEYNFVTTLFRLDESGFETKGFEVETYMIVGKLHGGGRMIILKLMFEKRVKIYFCSNSCKNWIIYGIPFR